MNTIADARDRANKILAGTHYFDALQIGPLGHDARALARVALDLADELEAERSARQSIQFQRDDALAILAAHAYDALEAAAWSRRPNSSRSSRTSTSCGRAARLARRERRRPCARGRGAAVRARRGRSSRDHGRGVVGVSAVDVDGIIRSSRSAVEESQAASNGHTEPVSLRIVTLEEFVAVQEPGAEPVMGELGAVVIPEGGDVLIYGDGGVGKTTLANDAACHLGAGDDWLGLSVPRPVRVLIIENEGPRRR